MQKGDELVVEVLAGRNLQPMDDNGLSDPYVVVSVGTKKVKTKIIRETLDPHWQIGPKGEVFTFDFKTAGKATDIVIKCMDWDRFKVDDRMGMVIIPIKDIVDAGIRDEWWPLIPQKPVDAVKGDLHMKIYMKGRDAAAQTAAPVAKKVKSDLWVAIEERKEAVVTDLLSKNPDLEEVDASGSSLLHLAVSSAASEGILQALLKSPINVNLTDSEGNTALHLFCKHYKNPRCGELVAKFIEKGANVNAVNNDGETPLHQSVFNPSLKVMMADCLLQNGANPDIVNNLGDSPVHYAVKVGRTDVIHLLVCYNANFDLAGALGQIPLVMAKGKDTVYKCIRDSLELARFLRSKGYEKYLRLLLEQEMYLFILQTNLDEQILSGYIHDKKDREDIIAKAQALPNYNRTETKVRVSELVKEKDRKRKQVEDLRISLQRQVQPSITTSTSTNSLGTGTETISELARTQPWEIDIEELEFVKSLGKGTSGEVFKGLWCGKQCAIKMLTTNCNEKELAEFEKEFSVMINVRSPNIVQFFGATLKEKMTMVMEFCEFGSLYHVLRSSEHNFGWARSIDMLSQIVNGIKVLHDHRPSILHRDLKTLNVLVTHDYECRVADFGLSRFDVSAAAATLQKCRGTYPYIAPEVYHGKGFGPESDIYSFSIIIWEMATRVMTGQYMKPFGEHKHIKMEVQILVQAAKLGLRPSVIEGTPASLKTLITDSYSADREKRPLAPETIARLEAIKAEYEANKEAWDALAKPMKVVEEEKPKRRGK